MPCPLNYVYYSCMYLAKLVNHAMRRGNILLKIGALFFLSSYFSPYTAALSQLTSYRAPSSLSPSRSTFCVADTLCTMFGCIRSDGGMGAQGCTPKSFDKKALYSNFPLNKFIYIDVPVVYFYSCRKLRRVHFQV